MEELKTVYDLLVEIQRVTIKNNKLLQEIEKIKEQAACAASPRYGFDKTSRTTTSTEDQWIHFIEEKTELEKLYRRNERRKKGLLRGLFKELKYLSEASRVTLVLWYV